MTLRASIAADVSSVFLQAEEFAEEVTYYPHRFYGEAARDPRVINAIVFREPIQALDSSGNVHTPVFYVHVANDVTIGIASEEIDLGGDQILMPVRDGETPELRSVLQITTQDHAMLVLECR